MEIAGFLLFVVVIFVFVMPLAAMARSGKALQEVEALRREWITFRQRPERQPFPAGEPGRQPEPAGGGNPRRPIPPPMPAPSPPSGSIPAPEKAAARSPSAPGPVSGERSGIPAAPDRAPVPGGSPAPPAAPPPSKPLNLEQFLGVRMFAWAGGLTLFLGVVFFVKYAFDQNLIPPAVRTAMGFLTGLALTLGGLRLHRRGNYEVLSRTLCATGMLVLYGVTFAAHALYRFPLFSAAPTFLLMAVITAVSFLLAVRLRALEVALLGMLGGFLAPVLCSTGQDKPLALFISTALLDIGLLAVGRRCRWPFLAALAAVGTLLTQFGWMVKFFEAEHYALGLKTWTVAAVFLVFPAVFLAPLRLKNPEPETPPDYGGGSALALLAGAMAAAFVLLGQPSVTDRPVLLFGFVFLIQALVMAVAWARPALRPAAGIWGAAVFIHLLIWTGKVLTPELLPWALGVYLIFGLIQIGFPAAWDRWRGGGPAFSAASVPWIPMAVQALTVLPVIKLDPVPFLIWPFLLGVNLLGIALAARSGRARPVLGCGAVTLLNAFLWLESLSADPAGLTVFLPVLAVFSMVLMAATVWLGGRVDPAGRDERELALWLPALSAGLPFLLLVMAVLSLPAGNPSPVFAVALLLAATLLWLSRRAERERLGAAALVCLLAVEAAWHSRSFHPGAPAVPLAWYAGLHVFFAVWPFLNRRRLEGRVIPWAVSALSGIGHFLLVHDVLRRVWPQEVNGLLPLAFSLPPLLGLAAARRGLTLAGDGKARLSRMAWFGGVALFFLTLAIPMQFRREWITLGWALEGAALCWLFRRVPHPGLKFTGMALLTVSFVRMGLNPLIFQYHEINTVPVLNWHLYGYGLTAAAQFAGAWQLRPPHHRWGTVPVRGILRAFGGILIFLLLNVEIADFFTPRGARFITFEFHGNFARDMVTSIAWGLFALGLMIIGFRWRQPATRHAGAGLLVVTLLKLFLHDLAQLGTLHRIGAFIAVAITALVASFLYQRFLNANPVSPSGAEPPEKSAPPESSGEGQA